MNDDIERLFAGKKLSIVFWCSVISGILFILSDLLRHFLVKTFNENTEMMIESYIGILFLAISFWSFIYVFVSWKKNMIRAVLPLTVNLFIFFFYMFAILRM